ncbi:protein C10-like [Planococcus citri]|uniref:protein C10-like n=1 Tax=Planococcus citri TaxID=170843 RepID=UPI0031F74205
MDSDHLQTPEYKISVILLQVLEKLKEEPISSKLKSAKIMAGNDSMRIMQYVLPIVMQVEMEVLKFHGYDNSREGLVKFTQLVKELEGIDSAIRNLHDVLKSQYLPSVSIVYQDDNSSLGSFS